MQKAAQRMYWPERVIRRFLATPVGVWFGQKVLARLDRPLLYLTRGRISMSPGQPVLLLENIGARSGKRRMTPLLYFMDGGNVIIIASNGGRKCHPAWYYNLRANPHAVVHRGGRVATYVAREAQNVERDALWRKAVDYFEGFALYEQRTARSIPVFILMPLQDARSNFTESPSM